MKKQIFITFSILLLVICLLLGCGDSGLKTVSTGSTSPTATPTENPDTNFTTNIETINTNTSGTLEMSGSMVSTGTQLELHLLGILNPLNNNDPIEDLTVANFTIEELPGEYTTTSGTNLTGDWAVAPTSFYYQKDDPNTSNAVDIDFIFDTTGSMGEEIDKAADSVQGFATALQAAGVDATFGIVTYGDAYDTLDPNSTQFSGVTGVAGDYLPRAWDTAERPRLDLSSNIDPLKALLDAITATGGNGVTENALGAMQYSYQTRNWRTNSQKIFIVVTDAPGHTPDSFESEVDGADPNSGPTEYTFWIPPTQYDLGQELIGNVVVHSIAPETVTEDVNVGEFSMATGGRFIEMPGDGDVDLVEYKLAETIAYSSVLTWVPQQTTGKMSYYITLTYGTQTGTIVKTVNYYNNI